MHNYKEEKIVVYFPSYHIDHGGEMLAGYRPVACIAGATRLPTTSFQNLAPYIVVLGITLY